MADAADDTSSSNPLLADFDFPPFDRVEPAHVRPGIRALLARLEGELEELEKGVEPAWERLVHPLERIVDRLDVVWNVVDHLKAVKDSADLRAAVEDVQPEKVKFYLRLGQSKPIYEAFNAIRNSSDWDSLSDARKRVVEGQIKDAVLGGVALEDEQREKFNQIQQELEKLSEKFSENVLDATKKFEKLITDKKEVDGLPASALGLAAQTAVSKGHENASAENGPWMVTLDAPSFMAVMQHAKNRALREEVYRAYLTRASSGDLDNTDIISQILKLRLEKAKLLGYKNFAEVSMAQKMATVDRVQELLEKIRAASWDHAVQDMEDLKAFVKDSGSAEANDLAHWDLNFWSERLRESKYDIDEEGLRPYFALPKVMDGLFSLANKLFGITVEAADGLAPVWNSDVKFYCVKDSSNSPVAYFYFDPYSRPSEKRGGAWMNVVFSRSSVLTRHGSSVRLPVAHMVCNQMPPVGDKPSLMTFREVETVFHEFGHALQHMLTRQDEAFVAGISGIEWDAVELPSQFMENWCYHKNTLLSIAKHYETGEPLPEEIYAKLVAAKNFRAGTFSLRQIRFANVDMELHTTYDPNGPVSVYDVDRRIAEKTQVLAPLPEDRFLCGFSHIFAGGYAAGYYSYKVVRQFKRPLDVSEKEIDAAGDGDVLVILDLRADQSLIEAGVAREVVNRIRRNPFRSCRQASALSSSTSERESFCPAGAQAKPTVPRARATGHEYLQSGTGASAKPSPKMGDSSVEVTEESEPNARVGTEFTGVRRQASGRYTAQAKDERGKDKHLGTFDTTAQAVKVRNDFVLNLELKEQLKKKKKKKKKEKSCIALEKRVVSAQENSSAAEESIAESPEEEKRPLQEGDRVKYVGQSRTLSNGQHGRIHKINGDQVAVLFDPTVCLLDTSDILHDHDNEAEDSYIAMQAFFEEKYMHRVQELEKKHMHEVQELEKKCTHEVQELNKELLLQNDAAATKEECFRAERLEMFLEAKNLRNTIINLTGQIRIFCRVLPLKKDETKCILDFDGAPKGDIGIMCGTKRVFKFDRVYTPNDDQAKVYSDVSPLVTSVMDGCNVCIFAYGQTGTGRTFTMEGTERDRGVNYRTLEELFKIAEEREDITYNISVVVLEIYNEEIRDLLATSSSSKKLEVRETCEGTHYVPGVEEVTVKDLNEVWGVLQSSNNSRAVGSNNVNEHSSRSHCALCVVVRATNLINGDLTKSKLWLVDLAGTERLTNTNAEGDRRNEAININNSLTCLGNVISSLVKREKHIPYRESNLTKLLQDSLGGDAKTLMILQLSPSENDASQTLTTLNYAQRARSWPAKKDVMMSKAKTARPPLQDVMMSKAKTARPSPAGSRAKLQQQTSTLPAGSRVKLQQQTSTPPAGSRVKLQQQKTPKTVRNFRM